ncbi:MAG: hypothetical protein K6F08_03145 [bacterium]|nr:hypothetical protein [bacterium]
MGEIINTFFTNMEVFTIIFLSLGLILLVIEVFVPGFGVFGVCGIISVGLSFFVRIIKTPLSVGYVFAYLGITIFLAVVVALFAIIIRQLILVNQSKVKKSEILTENLDELVGKNGVSVTDLEPSGRVMIDEKIYEASSDGKLIEKNTAVSVTKIENNIIIVDLYKK